jgi:hypothetical protein
MRARDLVEEVVRCVEPGLDQGAIALPEYDADDGHPVPANLVNGHEHEAAAEPGGLAVHQCHGGLRIEVSLPPA